MCTVTFSPRRSGYVLAMNRDEQLARVVGWPPRNWKLDQRTGLSPTEPGGGTWISVNDAGTTLALINWYAVRERVARRQLTRGLVVNAARADQTPEQVEAALVKLRLARINPFRLIGIFPVTHEVTEWGWNLKKLERKDLVWNIQQWISSGFDESEAQRVRGRVFREALRQKSVATLEWLRRLHRSHLPESGPFSTCMHRADAATVSYTEVVLTPRAAVMRYQVGAPCSGGAVETCRLSRTGN